MARKQAYREYTVALLRIGMGGHPVGTQDEGVAKGRGGEVGEGGRGRGVGVGVGVRGGRGEEKGEVVFAGQVARGREERLEGRLERGSKGTKHILYYTTLQ